MGLGPRIMVNKCRQVGNRPANGWEWRIVGYRVKMTGWARTREQARGDVREARKLARIIHYRALMTLADAPRPVVATKPPVRGLVTLVDTGGLR